MSNVSVTKEEIIYFLDMIDSSHSPNCVPQIGRRRPYWKLLKNRKNNVDEYERFLKVYLFTKDILSEKEQFILDKVYGVDDEIHTETQVAKIMKLSKSRIGYLKRMAELAIERNLNNIYKL